MNPIENFNDYKLSLEEVAYLKEMIWKVNTFFQKGEKKEEFDILLNKEYNRLMEQALKKKWLKEKEIKKYINRLKTFIFEDEYIFSLLIMVFTSLTSNDVRILDVKESYMYLLTDVFFELEIPLTRYTSYLSCLLEEDIPTFFERETCKELEPRGLLIALMEDVNFFNHKEKVMDDLRWELEERLNNHGKTCKEHWFDENVTIQEVERRVKEQMLCFNDLVPIYAKEDFKRAERCKKIQYLSSEQQKEFLELIREIDFSKPALKEKIEQILIAINIYNMLIQDTNLITPEFGNERRK